MTMLAVKFPSHREEQWWQVTSPAQSRGDRQMTSKSDTLMNNQSASGQAAPDALSTDDLAQINGGHGIKHFFHEVGRDIEKAADALENAAKKMQSSGMTGTGHA